MSLPSSDTDKGGNAKKKFFKTKAKDKKVFTQLLLELLAHIVNDIFLFDTIIE